MSAYRHDIEAYLHQLEPRAQSLLLLLWTWADPRDPEPHVYPSRNRLAAILGVSDRSVRRGLCSLANVGAIRRDANHIILTRSLSDQNRTLSDHQDPTRPSVTECPPGHSVTKTGRSVTNALVTERPKPDAQRPPPTPPSGHSVTGFWSPSVRLSLSDLSNYPSPPGGPGGPLPLSDPEVVARAEATRREREQRERDLQADRVALAWNACRSELQARGGDPRDGDRWRTKPPPGFDDLLDDYAVSEIVDAMVRFRKANGSKWGWGHVSFRPNVWARNFAELQGENSNEVDPFGLETVM